MTAESHLHFALTMNSAVACLSQLAVAFCWMHLVY